METIYAIQKTRIIENMQSRLTQVSKAVSYALRHAPWEYELELDDEGWVTIDELLSALHSEKKDWADLTEKDLQQIIAESSKQRHEIKDGKIRALYGHSTPNKLMKKPAEPPKYLYHGTSPESVKIICESGLKPMARHYVHLSADIETAKQVGLRKSKSPKILMVRAKEAFREGISFYIGNEHVWLADDVPPEYIEIKMKLLTEAQIQNLSFSDCKVEKMQFDISNRIVDIKTDGAYVVMDECVEFQSCRLMVKNWESVSARLYRAKTKQWEELDVNCIEKLVDICEFNYDQEIVFRGFGAESGQWVEITFTKAALEVICDLVIEPDIFVSLKFYSQDKGGRKIPTPANFFSCIFVIDHGNHDARLLLETIGSINPGDEKENVPVKFLCADLVIPKIKSGDKFYIRDGGVVAEGIVQKIINTNPANTT